MKVITICGSLRYQDEMMAVAQRLALNGYCVLTPTYPVKNNINLSEKQVKKLKEAHFKRIEMSDCIYVLNIDNYIGQSTKLEIEHAKDLNKEIIYHVEAV